MKNEEKNDFDLVRLSQLIYTVINRRKKLILLLFVAVFSVGIYNYLIQKEIKNSYYLIKCNTHFFHNNNDLKTIGLELGYNLSNYINNKNYDNLSSLIDIQPEKIKILNKIKIVDIGNNGNYFRLYLYYEGKDSSLHIAKAIIDHMNNQPLLKKQKQLNEQYYLNYITDIDNIIQSINSNIKNDTINSNDNKSELSGLIKQKNNLINQSKINDPFYILNVENNIAIKKNNFVDLFKYIFYFLFLTFNIVIVVELVVFLKKNNTIST